MVPYRVVPIPDTIVDTARTSGRSPQYGHPTHVEIATGYGPCRSCLRPFRQGEEKRMLFTYDPFDGIDTYPSPGPIFVHEERCEAFAGPGFPPELAPLPITLEGYGEDRWLIARERVEGDDVDAAIARVLGRSGVRYIHVRNTEAGCYMARIERLEGGAA